MKRRFRDVFGTAVILMPRLISAVIVLLLIYYFFAIIGLELFGTLDLKNCCQNSSVEQYYKFVNGSEDNQYYWLNNFQSLPSAGVVLFELTVVNNWYVIMDGYAAKTNNEWSRAYFMIFYIFTMIVMTIIVAFILEAFLFRIQFTEFLTRQEGKMHGIVNQMLREMIFLFLFFSEIKKMTAEITLNAEELLMLVQRNGSADQYPNISQMVSVPRTTFIEIICAQLSSRKGIIEIPNLYFYW